MTCLPAPPNNSRRHYSCYACFFSRPCKLLAKFSLPGAWCLETTTMIMIMMMRIMTIMIIIIVIAVVVVKVIIIIIAVILIKLAT
jgi:hypothetical protein